MKQTKLSRILFSAVIVGGFLATANLNAQPTPVGVWATVADKGENKGKVTSHIQIWKGNDGKLGGTIIRPITNPDGKCSADCPGRLSNKPLKGLTIMWGFSHAGGNKWEGGKIVDPEDGSVYSCNMTLQGNRLLVRGYIGFSALGRTQTWQRVQ